MLARALLFLWTVALVGVPAHAADPKASANVLLGLKAMDTGYWESVDPQPEFGVLLSLGRADWPVMVALDLLTSSKDGGAPNDYPGPSTRDVRTREFAVGARKIWGSGAVHPYVGAGVAWVQAEVDLTTADGTYDANDRAIGPWIGSGVYWRIGRRFQLGIDARWSHAGVFFDFSRGEGADEVEAGGIHAGVTLGVEF